MKEFDGIVKGVIAAAIIGLFSWVMTINADVKVNTTDIKHNKQVIVMRELTKAIQDLRIEFAKSNPNPQSGG
jgi:hypothetical protein